MGVIQELLDRVLATQGRDPQQRVEMAIEMLRQEAVNEKEREAEEHPTAFRKAKK